MEDFEAIKCGSVMLSLHYTCVPLYLIRLHDFGSTLRREGLFKLLMISQLLCKDVVYLIAFHIVYHASEDAHRQLQ